MARKTGRPHPTVNMAIMPDEPEYQLPPPEECEDTVSTVPLAIHDHLVCKFSMWKDRYMVEFAVMQRTRMNDRWHEIVRIDTCHNEVHSHRFRRNGTETRTVLQPIPAAGGWDVVDRWYDKALSMLESEWQRNLDIWQGQ